MKDEYKIPKYIINLLHYYYLFYLIVTFVILSRIKPLFNKNVDIYKPIEIDWIKNISGLQDK